MNHGTIAGKGSEPGPAGNRAHMGHTREPATIESLMISTENKVEMLRNCAFLSGAPERMLADLAATAGIIRVPGGEDIVRTGEEGSTMYIIASGEVHVHEGDVSRAVLGEGEVFGEMSVLDSEVRSATVTTRGDAMLLSLERDDLFAALAEHPECFQGILRAVLGREREIVQLAQSRSERLLSYQKELEIGRRIQADFLPDDIPEIHQWEIATRFEAAREVAGDFLDAFRLESGPQVAIVIGDVCDKGVGAALYMTLFRSLIRASSLYGQFNRAAGQEADGDRAGVTGVLLNSIVSTNRYVATTHPKSSMFASVFFGLFDPDSGELSYVNAGHEAPVIFTRDGSVETLDITGGVLGLFPFARYSVGTITLKPGDLLFAYTDGVNEAKNDRGEQFSEERIHKISGAAGMGAGELVERVASMLADFRGEADRSDDITMIALKRLAGGAGG